MFARARRYASLTPAERALLRLLEGLALVALMGAATAGTQYLASQPGGGSAAIDWPGIARVCVAGGAVAVLMALTKYFKAHGDPALADALGQLGVRVASQAAIGDVSAAAAATPPAPVAVTEAGAEGTMSR
ncbi:MAG: hypothetical protein PVSMB4_04860 [Ktedonobacterales bacterium]